MFVNTFVQMFLSFGRRTVKKPWVYITKALLCSLGFFICIYCLLKVNTIPVRNDEIKIKTFKTLDDTKFSFTVNLGNAYYGIGRWKSADTTVLTLSSVFEDKRLFKDRRPKTFTEWNNELSQRFYRKRKAVHYMRREAVRDSLTSILTNNFDDINKDSLYALFSITIRKDVGSYSVYRLLPSATQEKHRHIIVSDSMGYEQTRGFLYRKIDYVKEKGHLIVKRNFIGACGFEKGEVPHILSWGEKNIINRKLNPYFVLEDISQSYYNLTLDVPYESINRLEIDFGGATRFTGIHPQPDQTTVSGIIYTDNGKISEINRSGLQLYCQFLETSTLQSVRIFVLTAFASLFFTLFWKCLYNFVVTVKWHRKKEERQRAKKE